MSIVAGTDYRIEYKEQGQGWLEVSLVRVSLQRARWGRAREVGQDVLARRRFKRRDGFKMRAFVQQLDSATEYARLGELGAFVRVAPCGDGLVQVSLVDRQVGAWHLERETRVSRRFDAQCATARVDAARYTAELQAWAEGENAARAAALGAIGLADTLPHEETLRREQSARRLAQALGVSAAVVA